MSRQEQLARVAAIFAYVSEPPRHCLGAVVKTLVDGDLRQQTVVHSHHHHALVAQALRQFL